jgi:hypothetical protein
LGVATSSFHLFIKKVNHYFVNTITTATYFQQLLQFRIFFFIAISTLFTSLLISLFSVFSLLWSSLSPSSSFSFLFPSFYLVTFFSLLLFWSFICNSNFNLSSNISIFLLFFLVLSFSKNIQLFSNVSPSLSSSFSDNLVILAFGNELFPYSYHYLFLWRYGTWWC